MHSLSGEVSFCLCSRSETEIASDTCVASEWEMEIDPSGLGKIKIE